MFVEKGCRQHRVAPVAPVRYTSEHASRSHVERLRATASGCRSERTLVHGSRDMHKANFVLRTQQKRSRNVH